MKFTLSLLLLAGGFLYASDDIKPKQWEKIKSAVFKKMGETWSAQFNQQYPIPSEAGVRDLAREFDFDEDDMDGDCWLESNPPQLEVKVNQEKIYGLTPGMCTKIICKVRQEMRQNKNQ